MRFLALILITAAPAFGQSLCSYTVTPTTFKIGYQAFTGSITVTPNAGSFCSGWSASVNPGVTWLHITAGGAGNGPGTVSFTADANPAGVDRTGLMTVAGMTVPVAQTANACMFSISPATASYPVGGGTGSVQVTANCSWQAATGDGSWIGIAANSNGTANGTVSYTIGANGCVAGRNGSIVIQTGLDKPPVLAIQQDGSPSNLSLSANSAHVDSGASDGRVLVNTGTGCPWSAVSDVSWMGITLGNSGSGNSGIAYHVAANTLAARTGNIRVTPAGVVAATLFTVMQAAAGPPAPVVTSVTNAASYAGSAVSPGEIITIFGSNLGPPALTLYQLSGGMFPASIAGTQVLFDGAAAPMIYTSLSQVSAVAPYSLAGKTTTKVQVQYQGVISSAVTMPVQAATPGIFSLDASGLGPAAILNQDNSINSGPNPASKGSVVSIYCTGGGVTNPASVDASVTGTPLPMLTQDVKVTIGGISAKIWYSGAAAQAIAGLTQINAEIPAGVTAGPAMPVVVQIGNWQSQPGVTISVQ